MSREDRSNFRLTPQKSKKKYRPWTREELEAFAKRDGWVRVNVSGNRYLITGIEEIATASTTAIARDARVGTDFLLRNCTQDDEAKTPCGVEVVE